MKETIAQLDAIRAQTLPLKRFLTDPDALKVVDDIVSGVEEVVTRKVFNEMRPEVDPEHPKLATEIVKFYKTNGIDVPFYAVRVIAAALKTPKE